MNRKNRKRLMSVMCFAAAAAMVISVTGCGKSGDVQGNGDTSQEQDNDNKDSSGGAEAGANDNLVKINYKVTDIKLPKEINYVSDFYWNGENIITPLSTYDYNEETNVSTQTTSLVTLDMEGKQLSSVELGPKKDSDNDNAYIGSMSFTDDGTVWYMESHSVNDPETYETLSQRNVIKHIDLEGNELLSTDVTEIGGIGEKLSEQNTYMQNFLVDSKGRMMFVLSSYSDTGSATNLIFLDENGEFVFEKDYTDEDGWFNGSFVGGDGNMYVMMYLRDQETQNMKMNCMKPDHEGKKMGDPIPLDDRAYNIIRGNEDYLGFYVDGTSIYGITYSGESEEYFNIVTNGLDIDYISELAIHGDDMLIPSNSYSDDGVVLNYVRKLDESEVKEKIEVKLAAYYIDDGIRSAAANYNKSDGDYVINITDYSRFNNYDSENEEDYTAGLTKLNAEIAAGNIPDIISINDTDAMNSLMTKGLFVDLNTFIDGEDGINRDDYYDHIFRAMEHDGKLYTISDSFYLSSFCVKKEFVPEDGLITWEQADGIIAANDGMKLLQETNIRSTFMEYAAAYDIDKYMNTDTGECSFNSPEFAEIIERSKDYPEEFDYSSLEENYWEESQMDFVKNRAFLAPLYISGYDSINSEIAQNFGGDMNVSIVGFPGASQKCVMALGNMIAVSAKSAHPDAGWQLIKSWIEYDESRNSNRYSWRFSVNRKRNEQSAEQTLANTHYTDDDGNEVEVENSYYINGVEVKVPNVTQADIDKVNQLIEETTAIYDGQLESIHDIITEEAANFYEGRATAQQAADAIQSRASIYLSERS